jgi:hypothetical protein
MKETVKFEFSIDALTPETLSMARLADYLKELAGLMGNKDAVHFEEVREGSAVLVQQVEIQAVPKVMERLQRVQNPGDVDGVHHCYERLNDLLRDDNAVGQLREKSGADIIQFPGRKVPKPHEIGPMRQIGNLTGQLIMIGGKDEIVPVHLMDEGQQYNCRATRDIATLLAPHLFRKTIRVYGEGEWIRDTDAEWTLKKFHIDRFDVLDDSPLSEVAGRLQAVEGANWGDQPVADLFELRHGSKGTK